MGGPVRPVAKTGVPVAKIGVSMAKSGKTRVIGASTRRFPDAPAGRVGKVAGSGRRHPQVSRHAWMPTQEGIV